MLNYAGLLALELTAGLAPASAAYKAAVLRLDEVSSWSRWRESNPRSGLTKTVDCRYPTPAWCPREESHLCSFHVTEEVCC